MLASSLLSSLPPQSVFEQYYFNLSWNFEVSLICFLSSLPDSGFRRWIKIDQEWETRLHFWFLCPLTALPSCTHSNTTSHTRQPSKFLAVTPASISRRSSSICTLSMGPASPASGFLLSPPLVSPLPMSPIPIFVSVLPLGTKMWSWNMHSRRQHCLKIKKLELRALF